mmetsp:Transcript_47109/g.54574  ORF Transcript_47109/g.54574 Transcript_47109/m.54574 type:complete len:323 (-) Transcript_47109:38-1006(-)
MLLLFTFFTLTLHLVSGTSSCSLTASVNVSVGTQTSKSKFVVSAEDCCEYCDSTPNCVAAIFNQYYCQPFSQVTTTEPSNTGVFIQPIIPTPGPSGLTPVPSQSPAPPAEQLHYYFLTTCADSTSCDSVADSTCDTEVVQPNECAFDNSSQKYVLVLGNANGAVRYTYNNSNCHGVPENDVLFPFQCVHVLGRYRRSYLLTNFTSNLTTAFVATSSTCLDPTCNTSCLIDFTGETGVCGTTQKQDSGASSYSMSSSGFIPSGPSGYILCFTAVQMMATFLFPHMDNCTARTPAVGYAMPMNQCLSVESSRDYIRNACLEMSL